ncbi:MAG: hypothetical protein IJO42_05125 [Clostridia bacterium]|nr:hypothetical protein [Clostridia bacterium]
MFVRTIRRSGGITAMVLLGAAVVLLLYPQAVSTGISRGLAVCGSVVIPTLFPFMLLSGVLASSSLCRRPGRASAWIAGRLFGLPPCCAPVILLSLVGGYPAGMLAAAGLYRQGQIRQEQLRRMSLFCIGAGPGFIINTVGAGLMGSSSAGVLLYAAQTAVSLGMGIWLGRGHRDEQTAATAPPSPRRPLTQVVGDTCGALVTLCGYVTLTAMVLSIIEAMGVSRWGGAPLSAVISAVLEVSCGCMALAGLPHAPLWLSLAVSWGGLSVHGQIAAALPQERILTPSFYGARVCHGLLSAAVTWGLFALFPVRIQTSSQAAQTLLYSVSVPASAMLLLLCFLAMLCFSEKKTGNYTTGVL